MQAIITVIRKRSIRFTIIPNELLENKNLSWAARGILSYLLSKPDNWKIRVSDLIKHGDLKEFSVRKALNLLRDNGYAQYTKPAKIGEQGKWEISDSPLFSRRCEIRNGVKRPLSKDSVVVSTESKESKESPSCRWRINASNEKVEELSSPRISAPIPAVWIPDPRTKEEKLAAMSPPINIPSQVVFEEFLSENTPCLVNARPYLYEQFCDSKWHLWKRGKWVPIQDWCALCLSLEEKMTNDMKGIAA